MVDRLSVLPPFLTSIMALVCALASVTTPPGITSGGTALALLGIFGLQVCWVLRRFAMAEALNPTTTKREDPV